HFLAQTLAQALLGGIGWRQFASQRGAAVIALQHFRQQWTFDGESDATQRADQAQRRFVGTIFVNIDLDQLQGNAEVAQKVVSNDARVLAGTFLYEDRSEERRVGKDSR